MKCAIDDYHTVVVVLSFKIASHGDDVALGEGVQLSGLFGTMGLDEVLQTIDGAIDVFGIQVSYISSGHSVPLTSTDSSQARSHRSCLVTHRHKPN